MLIHAHRAAFALTVVAVLALGGCDKGPAEKAGERIDNSMENLTEGHDKPLQKGPAQQAGENLDKATGE